MRILPVNQRAGFSLIEVIISVSIVATLTAVAVPVAGTFIRQNAVKATKAEMEVLAGATETYFIDTLELPTSVADLIDNQALGGWTGPYLRGAFPDPISGSVGYEVDQWSQPYRFVVGASAWQVVSYGPDGKSGNADDIVLEIDVTYLRRAETLERLKTLNQAITIYNATNIQTDPLPMSLSGILSKLVTSGLLPDSPRYEVDAWGDAFVEDPRGLSPVVRVGSIHLSASAVETSSQLNSGPARVSGGNGRGRGRGR